MNERFVYFDGVYEYFKWSCHAGLELKPGLETALNFKTLKKSLNCFWKWEGLEKFESQIGPIRSDRSALEVDNNLTILWIVEG